MGVKLDTTQIYTQVSIKKLKEVHSLPHPAKARRTKTIDWDDEPEVTEEALFIALAAEDDLE